MWLVGPADDARVRSYQPKRSIDSGGASGSSCVRCCAAWFGPRRWLAAWCFVICCDPFANSVARVAAWASCGAGTSHHQTRHVPEPVKRFAAERRTTSSRHPITSQMTRATTGITTQNRVIQPANPTSRCAATTRPPSPRRRHTRHRMVTPAHTSPTATDHHQHTIDRRTIANRRHEARRPAPAQPKPNQRISTIALHRIASSHPPLSTSSSHTRTRTRT